ncbi:PPE domain-containing protein [Mycobacterium spongiae]|uniref:PPE domain-containing protein n=2 Tax=Mycobacterium spongiae TaxID=886343 RepID=A0A975JUP4_9MYCO|nr:PPE domain-containing protein [Mycobacterium spongiae]
MTGPIWMASPPEVHSALLSAGPGPGSLLAAAGAWNSLSVEYSATAAELTGLLGEVQAGAWQGPTAQRYVAAHVPYVAWLAQASADAAGAAAQHEAAAAAYAAALAAMPTLPELATNHVVHGVLVATNFFGINTIPIALNEADYVRMWMQAAATMGLYQAGSGAALASVPPATPAPPVVNPGGGVASSVAASSAQSSAQALAVADIWQWLLQLLQNLWNAYVNFFGGMFQLIGEFLQNPIGNSIQIIIAFLTNPAQALVTYGPLLFALGYQTVSLLGWPTWAMILSSPFLGPVGLSVGLGAIALLPTAVAPAIVPAAAAPLAGGAVAGSVWSVAGVTPTGAGAGAAPAGPAGAGAPAGGAPAPAAQPASMVAYAVGLGGDDGPSLGPTVGGRSGIKAPAATVPAAAAAATSRAQARRRRRKRTELRDFGNEFADMESDISVAPPTVDEGAQASDQAAGSLGFAGTAPKEHVVAAVGLTALPGDEFGGGPHMPMMPGTWDQGGSNPGESAPWERGGDDVLQRDSR